MSTDEASTPPSTSASTSPPPGEPVAVRKGFWLFTLPGRMRRNIGAIWQEHKVLFVISGFVFAFFVVYFWNDIFVKIRAGEAGVIYRLFQGGTVTEKVYGEGLQIVAPWNTLFVYDARVQQVPDHFVALSQDGLAIKIEVSIRFRPQFDELGLLHKNIGPDYIEKLVKPEVQAQLRLVVGQYKPEEIYTSQGFIVQTAVQGALAELAERYVLLDDLLLTSVILPTPVAESIESKLRAQQLALEYVYRIESETREAERKKVEAQGIRDFQDTITGGGISDQFLRFKGIEATLELAKSANAKIVIIGGGDDRLPLILDGANRGTDTPPIPAPKAPTKPGRPPPSGPLRR